jgi:hypothetical protein
VGSRTGGGGGVAGLFAALVAIVIVTAGPVWDEIVEFVHALPGYWEDVTSSGAFKEITSTAGIEDKVASALKDLAAGLAEAASTLLGIAGGVFGTLLSLVTLTFLALFLLMERPTITDWLFGFTSPGTEARWRPVLDDSILAVSSSLIGNLAISAGGRDGRRPVGVGVRPAVPDRAGPDHGGPRPHPASRRHDRRGDLGPRRAHGQHPGPRSRWSSSS